MFVSGTWKNPKSYWVTATRAKRYAVVEDCQIACLCVWTILAIGGVRMIYISSMITSLLHIHLLSSFTYAHSQVYHITGISCGSDTWIGHGNG